MDLIYGNKFVKNDEYLKVSETQVEPEIKLNFDKNRFYTLIMYDPNAVEGTYIH